MDDAPLVATLKGEEEHASLAETVDVSAFERALTYFLSHSDIITLRPDQRQYIDLVLQHSTSIIVLPPHRNANAQTLALVEALIMVSQCDVIMQTFQSVKRSVLKHQALLDEFLQVFKDSEEFGGRVDTC